MINMILFINIVFMLFFGVILAYSCFLFADEHYEDHDYIFEGAESPKVLALKSFGSFFLLNNSFIPLDLAVGLEMGKFVYIYFLENDLHMTLYDADKRDLVSC